MLPEIAPSDNNAPCRPNSVLTPVTEAEHERVREQLRRILSSPAFQNSKRYAAVLKYVVEQTLEGAGARLKERTIGIDIFGRTPDYDTASDHVVRSAIAEVRKRLGQYYQMSAKGELRIEVQPGCYTPQFRWPEILLSTSPAEVDKTPESPLPLPVPPAPEPPSSRTRMHSMGIAVGLLVLLAGIAVVFAFGRRHDALDSFWHPLLSSREPALLCLGNQAAGWGSVGVSSGLNPSITLGEFRNSEAELVQVEDALTLAKLTGFMQANGMQVRLASQSDTTFTDLQGGPAILVGLMNNNWTQRLVSRLRFTVIQTSPNEFAIRDLNNPSRKDWSIDYSTPHMDVTRDYAIVLRMLDPKTEQMVVVAAGLSVFGTHAAGEFLTSKSEMKKLAAVAPPGWEKKNIEFVLSTDVIRGRSGPASVVAVQSW